MAKKAEYLVVKDGEVLASSQDSDHAQQLAHNFNGATVETEQPVEADAGD